MISSEIKENYINLINKVNADQNLKNLLTEFIQTYNGTNEKEFHNAMLGIIKELIQNQELKIKAGGYDRLKIIQDNNEEYIEEIKDKLDEAEKHTKKPTPFITVE